MIKITKAIVKRFLSKPEKQFLLLTFFILLIIGIIINISLSSIIKRNFIEDRKNEITEYLNHYANHELTAKNFLTTNYLEHKPTFKDFFENLSHKEIIRIKVFNKDARIVYSDEEKLIGEQFLDNTELLEALEGNVIAEILKPLNRENTYEKGYEQMMEIYVPVYLNNVKPIGVIEAYYKLDGLNSLTRQMQIVIGITTIFIFTILFLGLYWIFKRASNQIDIAHIRESDKLKEITRLRDEFVFVAVHELRTPVTVIRGYLDVIFEENKQLKKDTIECLEQIKNADNNLLTLVNDLLEVAKSESGKLKVTVSPQNIQEITNSCIKELKALASQKNILINNRPNNKLPLVLSDSEKLKEILMNLIGNAIKYTNNDGKITLSYEVKDGAVVIHIKDTGIGLSDEDKKHLFEKFWRSENIATHGISGTGLGLFITKELIERMSGKIWVESEEGHGSTFSFKLPLAKG